LRSIIIIFCRIIKNINKNIINNSNQNFFYNDVKKIEILDKRLKEFAKEKISPIQKVFFLIDMCKNYGTLPFSGIARSAFVATSILRDLQKNEKKTIILVEQNAKKGLEFADIGYVLVSGQTAIAGKGDDLLNNPDVGRLFLGG